MTQTIDTLLQRFNAVRLITVVMIAFGYATTMPLGPGNREYLAWLGIDPSWYGIQLLFFLSGILALRSIRHHKNARRYLLSKARLILPTLVLLTVLAVFIIFPLFGSWGDSYTKTVLTLLCYMLETITCVNPGRAMPGLLDEAKYTGLIQGAIWTFRWGALLHIGVAVGYPIGLWKDRCIIGLMALVTLAAYAVLSYVSARHGLHLNYPYLITRLSWPFLTGMAAYAYRKELLDHASLLRVALITTFITAIVNYTFFTWTPMIEISATLTFMLSAWLLLNGRNETLTTHLSKTPNLALGLYAVNWPVSQILLLMVPTLSPWELAGMSLPLSLLCAGIIHHMMTPRSGDPSSRKIRLKTA